MITSVFQAKQTPPEGTKGAQILMVFTYYCTQSKEGTCVLLAAVL